jgi:hypothetical protein
MSYIVSALPPIKCFVKREFLYNFTKGDDWFYNIEERKENE